ncbi:Methylated-DNA--protein-cysteine methyltransferase [Anatilimnocola aggregata]|uniref:Methylated-DNA--protein-cysteine methyltransferase n=1 Tax=Anatilimnocola aggregata TaxID=2528021 RepID=A0A517Y694_9BACT|nr:methylated-DNA--[protein]-cysteine S-methyltransferase [Anatilimnocola aggregata]QDU25757.1 Methylated-DNA--protein-cysteine methyltransferase [Anatilimnocola aggregata]
MPFDKSPCYQPMNATTHFSYIDSPLGQLFAQGSEQFVTGLYLPDHKGWQGADIDCQQSDAPFAALREQLAEYFAGERQQFDVALQLLGTPFQQRVWQELVRIPFGETITYGELARRVGQPTAARAVGHANGRNPISILVPCHRVIGTSGKLTGYAGGVERKEWLLAWEHSIVRSESSPLPRSQQFVTAHP